MVTPKKKDKSITPNEAYLKISSFCAYQERTQQEVRNKLYGYDLNKDLIEEIISKLITENFINEERFAKVYAGGKFRIKKWGRGKILQNLKQKGLSKYCITQGMNEIENQDYTKTIRELIDKKEAIEKEKDPYRRKHKIAGFLIRKGYEPDIVWEILLEKE